MSPLAGKPAPAAMLVDVARLIAAYYDLAPDPAAPAQRVTFGTSGHRGSSFERTFNEAHVLAICQAICLYRRQQGIAGPVFIGIDTHALSRPAFATALEVFAANDVEAMMSANGAYTPTPAVSHAILAWNRRQPAALADGIVVTPSHNPPDNGGIKYNGTHGGPADTDATAWIEREANAILEAKLEGVRRVPFERALAAATTHRHDFMAPYVNDLGNVIDMDAIRGARIRMGVDPLGGAGVHYWAAIARRHGLDLTVVNDHVNATFGFMTLDWDGRIRMDPSSPYAMQSLIGMRDRFDIAFACDTDHDRHGIVTRGAGLMPANHYLSASIDYLFQHRPDWRADAAIGKTVVSTQMIDRVAMRLRRRVYEAPAGFKWFATGLADATLGFAGEESAGASFLRRDGAVWTTEKDGIAAALLSAEMTARTGHDPAQAYAALTREFGECAADRIEAPASPRQRAALARLSPRQVRSATLAGEPILSVITRAPGNDAPIGGLKVTAQGGWFAARPSGTENLCKIYGESWRGEAHLREILGEAQAIVDAVLADSEVATAKRSGG